MSFNTKSEILAAIAKTEDQALKTVLLLMLGVFEDLGEKIDSVLTNETALRTTVLNGHEPVHHQHHEWVRERMARDEEVRVIVSWVKAKMADEQELKGNQSKAVWNAISNLVTHGAMAIGGAIVVLMMGPK